MRKVNVCDANLTQRLDRRTEEALKNLVGDPLAIALGVRCPELYSHRCQDAEQVYGSLAILQSKRLPD